MSSVKWAFVLGVWMGLASPAAATVHEVNAAAACPGSGTVAAPFCSIGQAAAVASAGDVVKVAAGIYREQVRPANSGAAGLPVTYRGAARARVYGSDDLSGAAWVLSSGSTYAVSYDPATNTRQVFVDGLALAESTAGPGSVPVDAFHFDSAANVLYVNLGGASPAGHDVEASARSFGFDVSNKSHIVIEGFEVRGHNTNGIRVRSSTHVALRNNRVLWARSFGIVADGTTAPVTTTGPIEIANNEILENGDAGLRLRNNVTLATVSGNLSHHNRNHGILASATTASVFASNQLHSNARPGGVSTTGLLLDGECHGNLVVRNVAHHNQDSGYQVSGEAGDPDLANVFARNLSYANGDHGFDVRQAEETRLISNTAHGNQNDGFSIEGNAVNTVLRNNLAAANGFDDLGNDTGGNQLWVDVSSTAGFSSDYDLLWTPDGRETVEYGGVVYHTLADFAAGTGHEAHGVGTDPLLVNPARGDFHPGLGGAIDAADASVADFEVIDLDGQLPNDVLAIPNHGAGDPSYADLGALERIDAAPRARLSVSPKKVRVRQLVTADASASSDDVGIVRYRFSWGDGTVIDQAGPVATHAYGSKGKRRVVVEVFDAAGNVGRARKIVQVR
jgi:parallel beta-helix repeat protein